MTSATAVELMATINDYDSHFASIPMYDDGQHGDEDASDSIYGAVIPFHESGRKVKYYIRARNDDALILSPRKAEYEFYEYSIGALPDSSIVINEINYNSSDDFDPEDWVELYNPTSETVSVGLWQFKDENDDHVFIIPEDQILDPDQYLVLCKDAAAFNNHFPDVNNYIVNLKQ